MSEEKAISKVLVMVAMTHEALAIIGKHKLSLCTEKYQISPPMVGYSGPICNNGGEMFLVINGPRLVNNLDGSRRLVENSTTDYVTVEGASVVPAAIATWEAIRIFNPDVIISAGTCGGVAAKGAVKGKVYLVGGTPVSYHDRLINFRLPGDNFEPNNYQAFGIGSFPSLPTPVMSKDLGLPLGILSTGASFDQSEGNVLAQFEKNAAFLKEMEAAAVAEVAQLKGVKFLGIKGVTDYIDPEHAKLLSHSDQFQQELVPVSELVATVVDQVITYMVGKRFSQL